MISFYSSWILFTGAGVTGQENKSKLSRDGAVSVMWFQKRAFQRSHSKSYYGDISCPTTTLESQCMRWNHWLWNSTRGSSISFQPSLEQFHQMYPNRRLQVPFPSEHNEPKSPWIPSVRATPPPWRGLSFQLLLTIGSGVSLQPLIIAPLRIVNCAQLAKPHGVGVSFQRFTPLSTNHPGNVNRTLPPTPQSLECSLVCMTLAGQPNSLSVGSRWHAVTSAAAIRTPCADSCSEDVSCGKWWWRGLFGSLMFEHFVFTFYLTATISKFP